MTERELYRLKHALTVLSEAEKHLRVSSEQSTWFIATLLQLGSISSPDRTQSTSSRLQTPKASEEEHLSMPGEAATQSDEQFAPETSGSSSKVRLSPNTEKNQFNDDKSSTVSNDDCTNRRKTLMCVDAETLISIWLLCIEKCHSKTLKLLLHSYGKLVSISEMEGKYSNRFPAFPLLQLMRVECCPTLSELCSRCIQSVYLIEKTNNFYRWN